MAKLADARQWRRAGEELHEYRSLRIHEMPEVEVTIIASTLAAIGHGRPRQLPMQGGSV